MPCFFHRNGVFALKFPQKLISLSIGEEMEYNEAGELITINV